jgi:hypothetical protein
LKVGCNMRKMNKIPHLAPNDVKLAIQIYESWQAKAKTADEFNGRICGVYGQMFDISESQTHDILTKLPGLCKPREEFMDEEDILTIEIPSDQYTDLTKNLPWRWIGRSWDENDLQLWQKLSDPDEYTNEGELSWKQPVPTKSLPDLLYNSKRIADGLPEPSKWNESGNRTGLVLGSVQSGKTASMLGVSSIVLDRRVGYQILIVLGGHTENLRTQTLERFEVFQKILRSEVHFPVRDDADLKNLEKKSRMKERRNKVETALGFLENKKPVIFVVKKNTAALSGLIAMMNDIHKSGKSYPTLIIDDESDHSSLNTKRRKSEKKSTIHQMIGDLRDSITQNAYLGYTATPQGILLSSPESKIFPRDFLWLLEPHDKYIGPDDFYNNRSAMIINTIDSSEYPNRGDKNVEDELAERKGILPEWQKDVIDGWEKNGPPISINTAIIDFVLTGAIRWDRVDKFEGAKLPDHSLMFHVNRLKDIHKKIGNIIKQGWNLCYNEFKSILENNMVLDMNKNYHILIEKRWKRILRNISSTRNDPKDRPNFEDLAYHIQLILDTVNKETNNGEKHIKDGIRIINSEEGSELQYNLDEGKGRPPKALILIGGDLLSRGLTVEGLCVSYYLRMTKTPSVDTELQRCRWFGAKSGYVDLLTLHIQDTHVKMFRDINEHNNDLMDQLRQATLKGFTGSTAVFMLKIRDSYQVTGYSKRGVIKKLEDSYSGNSVSFNQPSVDYAEYNMNLLDNYLGSLRKTQVIFGKRGKLWENVDPDKIIKLLKEIKIDNDSPRKINPHDLSRYLKKWKNDKDRSFPEINIVQRFGRNTQISERKRDTEGRDGIWYPLSSFTLLSTSAGKNWTGCKWADAVNNERGEMDKKKMNSWFEEGHQKYERWDRNFSPKRKKGAPILIVFYKLDKNYINLKDKNNGGDGKWYLDENNHDHLIANDDLVTFIASLPTGGPTGGGIVNAELYGSVAMKMIAGRELDN